MCHPICCIFHANNATAARAVADYSGRDLSPSSRCREKTVQRAVAVAEGPGVRGWILSFLGSNELEPTLAVCLHTGPKIP